jgi:beta-lactamase superfamily II metal-dependent hydrolase
MRLTFTIDVKKLLLLTVIIGGLAILLTYGGSPRAGAQATQRTGRWLPGTLEIHHIYVGQGDSVLMIAPNGKTLLYDIGERDWPLHENAEQVTQYVEQVTGKREIDYVVLSHFHQDHVGNSKLTESKNQYDGGIFWLLKNHALNIHKVIDRGFEPLLPHTPIAQKYKEFSESEEGKKLLTRETARLGPGQIDLGPEINVTIVAANGKVYKDGKEVTVLSDQEIHSDPPPSENDLSLCLKITWNDFEYFIGGDLSGQNHPSPYGYKYHDIESAVADAVGNIEVYRVSHHGSDHSSNAHTIATLDPEVSIVSAGTANRFGHPRQEVIDGLLATGDLFVTAREGGASSAKFKRAVGGGNVIVRVYNGGYNYEVALVRSYRSFTEEEESKHLDQVLDYEQEQVRYEEAQGAHKPDDDDDGNRSGDLKAGKNQPDAAAGHFDESREKGGFARVRAKDHARLEQYVGKKIYVWGKVTSTFTPASNKVKFLNIDTEDLKESFTIVIFNKDWQNFYETAGIGDPCKYYQNKWIEVSGVITGYQQPEKKKDEPAESDKSKDKPNEKSSEKSSNGAKAQEQSGQEAKPKKLEVVVSAPYQIEVLPFRQE